MLLFLLQTVTSTSRSDYNRQLGGYEREREVEKVKMQKEREKKEAQRQISAFFMEICRNICTLDLFG